MASEGRLPDRIWVARLDYSHATAHKIRTKHRLDPEVVRLEIECVEGVPFAWNRDPERGLRAIVDLRISRRPVIAVLYPVDGPETEVWNLGSAYRVDGGHQGRLG